MKGEAVKDDRQSLSFQDVIRESIHLGGFIVLLLCKYFINWEVILTIILIVSLVYIMSEIGRMFGKNMPIISYITSKASGKLEFQEPVTSPIFYALAVIGTLLFFSKPVGYTSMAVLTLGDSCATIFGKLFGRRHIPFNKSKNIEGTLFGLLAAFLGSLFFVDPVKAMVASSAGMLIELFPSPVNDNLTIPLASGLALASTSAFL